MPVLRTANAAATDAAATITTADTNAMTESTKAEVIRTLKSLKDTAVNGKSLEAIFDAALNRVQAEVPDPNPPEKQKPDPAPHIERNLSDIRYEIGAMKISSVDGQDLSSVADAMSKALDNLEPKIKAKDE